MLHDLHQMFAPPVMERLTLLLNHVLGAEPVATQRLLPHSGKELVIEALSWPRLLPPLPALAWRVTPAGLLEWCGLTAPDAPALRLAVRADNPARLLAGLLSGAPPDIEVAGDAQFATDLSWLMQNLRWEPAADLERLFPPPLAAGLHRVGSAFARGLRAAVQGLASMRQRWQTRQGI